MHTYKLKAKCRTGESTGERDRVIGIVKMRAKRKIEAKPLETDSHPRSGVLNLSCLTIAIFPFQIHLPPFLHFHWKLFVTTRYVCVCVCTFSLCSAHLPGSCGRYSTYTVDLLKRTKSSEDDAS